MIIEENEKTIKYYYNDYDKDVEKNNHYNLIKDGWMLITKGTFQDSFGYGLLYRYRKLERKE